MATHEVTYEQSSMTTVGLEKRVQSIAETAQSIIIRNPEDYRMAGELCQAITGLLKEADGVFDPIIKKAYETHRESIAQKKKICEPLERNRALIDGKILEYDRVQEELRREEERRRQEEAKRIADEQALREAEQYAAEGDHETANLVIQEAVNAPLPVVSVPSVVPKVAGLGKKVEYYWLLKKSPKCRDNSPNHDTKKCSVCIAQVPIEYLELNEVKINGVVRALKKATQINGIEVLDKAGLIHRA